MTKAIRAALKTRLNATLVDYLNSRVSTKLLLGRRSYSYSDLQYNDYEEKYYLSGTQLNISHLYNRSLSSYRFICINNLLYNLERAFNGTKELTIDEVGAAKTLISNAISENSRLSRMHGKSHVSYKDGKALGLSAPAAWWQKTFMQSHANGALEKCLELVETVEARLTKALKSVTTPTVGSPA